MFELPLHPKLIHLPLGLAVLLPLLLAGLLVAIRALSGLTALTALAGALAPARLRTATRLLAVAGALGAMGMAVRTGALGGELVYRHGAARAWTAPAPGEPQSAPQLRAHEGDD